MSAPARNQLSAARPVAWRDTSGSSDTRVRILFVPGFVADTYSEIERSYVELCAATGHSIEYIWLVTKISPNTASFAKPDNRSEVTEPAYVPHLRAAGISYVVETVSRFNAVANMLMFRRIFARYQIDAVYTHFGYERFWATFCARLFGVTTIWNEHWHSLGRRLGGAKRLFYRLFVDDFISISHFITSTLPPSSRVHTVRNAISGAGPTPRTDAQKSELRTRLNIPLTSKVVLMVAAFRTEKRHLLALDICARVLQVHKDVVFVFPGGGPLRATFVSATKARGLTQHVIVPGHVDNIDEYYAMADITMLTSLDEPFGYVVLEAMRQGLSMVAFDNGGPAEIVRQGETGFLVPEGSIEEFASALIALIGDESLRAKMGNSARLLAQREFSREVWVHNLADVLKSIVLDRRAVFN